MPTNQPTPPVMSTPPTSAEPSADQQQPFGSWWVGQFKWFVAVLIFAAGADLISKAVMTGWWDYKVTYNMYPEPLWERLAITAATLAVLTALGAVARRRGMTSMPGLWATGGLLVGAVLAQGASVYIWERGVPDFIPMSIWAINVADIWLAVGLFAMIISFGYYGLKFVMAGRPHESTS